MKQYKRTTVDGVVEYFNEPLIADGKQIFNPSEEMILAAGWEEYTPEETASEEYVPTYEERVVELIRERYSIDDEIGRTPSKMSIKHGMTIARRARRKQKEIMFNFKIKRL